MGEESPRPRILVCGLGNQLKGDDGLGPHVIAELEGKGLPADVGLMDFGISGLKAVLEIGKYDRVILVDAVKAGGRPGEIYRTTLSKEDLLSSPSLSSFTISLHEVSLEGLLVTAALLDSYPQEVILIGCEPKDLSFGLHLSKEVEGAVGQIIDLILDELSD